MSEMIPLLSILSAFVLGYILLLLWLRDPNSTLQLRRDVLRNIPLHVPERFLWGSATSAHQVEGGCTNNNWSVFESSPDPNGRFPIAENQRTGAAADHWNRYRGDVILMKDLSLNAYRFSVEWSKIEPREGQFDTSALDHYAGVVHELRANGIEPMVTLHHFTNPIWFERRGAFLQAEAPALFSRFVKTVAHRLGDQVKLWITFNEPSVYAFNGYLFGEFPPGDRNAARAVKVLGNMLRAHTEAYRTIKENVTDAEVGPALNVFVFDPPSRLNLLDVVTARLITSHAIDSSLRYLRDGVWKVGIPGIAYDAFRSSTTHDFDFVGLNYYTRFRKRVSPFARIPFVDRHPAPPERCSDMGWEIYPEGLYRSLKLIHKALACPIMITENGIADDSDTKRADYIKDHLLVMNKAMADGIDVRGYFYWSLLDNFEWSLGYTKRFGLYHVDFLTQQRTLRDGSKAYPQMIEQFRQSGIRRTG